MEIKNGKLGYDNMEITLEGMKQIFKECSSMEDNLEIIAYLRFNKEKYSNFQDILYTKFMEEYPKLMDIIVNRLSKININKFKNEQINKIREEKGWI